MAEKKSLDDLKKNLMSNEELENVAGGNHEENLEIYNKICSLNFDKGMELQNSINLMYNETKNYKEAFDAALSSYLQHELKLDCSVTSYDWGNKYYLNKEEEISHKEFMKILDGILKKGNDF